MLDKNTNTEHVKISSKYVLCDMRFLVIKINILPCFLNGFGIAVSVFSF